MTLPTSSFLKQAHWVLVLALSIGGITAAYYAGKSKSDTIDATTELRVTTLEKRVDALGTLVQSNEEKAEAKIERMTTSLDARLRAIETGVARIEQSLTGKPTGHQ